MLVPILLTFLVVHLAINLPWPHVPFPDLPSVPWPDIPTPDLPDWHVPDEVWWVLDKAKYVWPVVVAYVIARAEIKRRRDRTQQPEPVQTTSRSGAEVRCWTRDRAQCPGR